MLCASMRHSLTFFFRVCVQTASAMSTADTVDTNNKLNGALVGFMVLTFVIVAVILAAVGLVVWKTMLSPKASR